MPFFHVENLTRSGFTGIVRNCFDGLVFGMAFDINRLGRNLEIHAVADPVETNDDIFRAFGLQKANVVSVAADGMHHALFTCKCSL
ncbi:MAG: hypothetical protein K0R65_902 [Crocinitomicaceae bacterium]|nr:hypothetical protein [Crocinitomicaceae bacterium]